MYIVFKQKKCQNKTVALIKIRKFENRIAYVKSHVLRFSKQKNIPTLRHFLFSATFYYFSP